MNIYLDIDGVLLDKNGIVADHFEEFLEKMLEKHDVFWLTTHCHGGECDAIDHISAKNKLSPRALELLGKIKMTDWAALKTDAIDFSQEFAWIDDYVMDAEKKVLLENNSFCNLHEVNLKDKPDLLASLMDLDYSRGLWNWQKIDLEISFSKEEMELIKKGFHSDKGMDEKWKLTFYDDTLYIMRHWTGWVNYKLQFNFSKGKYTSINVCLANLASENKTGETTFQEKNWHGVFIIWLIENYLLGIDRNFLFDPAWFQLKLQIPIDSIHGYNHWKSVEKIGHYIADSNGADKKLISMFAFLHDIGRTVQFAEPGHGEKSAEIIKEIFKKEYLELNDEQYAKLLEAVSEHDKSDAKSDDITIQTCWDADRLDLPRVYILPDKNLLYTEVGKSEETFDYFKIGG